VHDEGGTVNMVRADRMRLGKKDTSGRESVDPIKDADFDIKADLVIKALGFMPEDMRDMDADIAVTRHGTLRVNPVTFETNLPGVYAAGDIARGASLVVWAIREGRDAAEHMHKYLKSMLVAQAAEVKAAE